MLYLLKHVEKHGREEIKDPWSVRQMGVYHRADQDLGDVFVIFNPSKPFQRRLKRIITLRSRSHVADIHLALLSSVTANWRWYITDLERNYEAIVDLSPAMHIILANDCRNLNPSSRTSLLRRRRHLVTYAMTMFRTFRFYRINVSSCVSSLR